MRICIISAHFPSYDLHDATKYATGFLFQYAEELVRQGHEIFVYDLLRVYPNFFRLTANITYKLGYRNLKKYLLPKEAEKEIHYSHHGVTIQRILYKKYIPHSITSHKHIKRIKRIIIEQFHSSGKKFDLIIGDCFDPTIQVMSEVKKLFGCPYYQVIHNSDFAIIKKQSVKNKLMCVDKWLIRSKAQKEQFDSYVNQDYDFMYMYSGIKESQIAVDVTLRNEIKKLLYVGTLIKSKGLETIIRALDASKNKALSLTVVGSGVDRDYFETLVSSMKLNERICFLGQKGHDEVLKIMGESDALVLISHETFGMVYVEAMSQACIPIGTLNEGIDGIVNDEENGYLCPLGDYEALSRLFDTFQTKRPERIRCLSQNALDTAKKLTTNRLARELIK